MKNSHVKMGRQELRQVLSRSHGLLWAVALFSLFSNLLMLTGPLYMLQVYDRVLGSNSQETLIALSILVIFLYSIMGILDYTRGRVMARSGARFQSDLDRRVFDAVVRKSAVEPDLNTQTGLADLEAIRRLLTSPVFAAAFDMPWTPVFFASIFVFHPMLGYLAVIGASVLVLIAVANQVLSRAPQSQANAASQIASMMADQIRTEAEMVQSMGMRDAAFVRWKKQRGLALEHEVAATDVGGSFSSVTKIIRLFLQSAMLGLGAWLVLHNELTAGAMIAGSILLGRALAPIEIALNQWPVAQAAKRGWENLCELLGTVSEEAVRTPLPKPRAHLVSKALTVFPPGERQASLKSVSFEVKPGQAVGVIGPSGAGKSTLSRTLTGVWRPASGSVRLDAAGLHQYEPSTLGKHIGYLPQRVQLFDGTIAENIARLDETPDAAKVVAAAKAAGAHEMILAFPKGYDTWVLAGQSRLSGGQMQRIGLARALYDDPVIVVLDEPNSNLDNVGSQALNLAIQNLKKKQRSVLIMAHRPAAIQECDMLMVLDGGVRMAFGPKDEVLKNMVKNHKQIRAASMAAGGVS